MGFSVYFLFAYPLFSAHIFSSSPRSIQQAHYTRQGKVGIDHAYFVTGRIDRFEAGSLRILLVLHNEPSSVIQDWANSNH